MAARAGPAGHSPADPARTVVLVRVGWHKDGGDIPRTRTQAPAPPIAAAPPEFFEYLPQLNADASRDVLVQKHQWGAFFGTDLEMILRAHDIDTLVLLGHATSGVIVSTVRYAADADYRLVVVEDGCADRDAEMHTFLMQRLFPRQATVVSAEAVIQALARR